MKDFTTRYTESNKLMLNASEQSSVTQKQCKLCSKKEFSEASEVYPREDDNRIVGGALMENCCEMT